MKQKEVNETKEKQHKQRSKNVKAKCGCSSRIVANLCCLTFKSLHPVAVLMNRESWP